MVLVHCDVLVGKKSVLKLQHLNNIPIFYVIQNYLKDIIHKYKFIVFEQVINHTWKIKIVIYEFDQ